jgi:hypothetical protein
MRDLGNDADELVRKLQEELQEAEEANKHLNYEMNRYVKKHG